MAAAPNKLAIMALPAHRERPVTNLGKVFGQFAELQQQMAEQVIALEDSVCQQRQALALAIAELPEMRERINWLIARVYEQSKNDESVRGKLQRHEAALATLAEAIEDILNALIRAKAALVPPLPEF